MIKPKIFFFITFILMVSLVSSQLGYSNPNLPKIDYIAPTISFNNNTGAVNTSDFWDLLDTPNDISAGDLGDGDFGALDVTTTGDLNVSTIQTTDRSGVLSIQPDAIDETVGVSFFENAATTDRPKFRIYGYQDSGAPQQRYMDMYIETYGRFTFSGTAPSVLFDDTILNIDGGVSGVGWLQFDGSSTFAIGVNDAGTERHPIMWSNSDAATISAVLVFTEFDNKNADFSVPEQNRPELWMHDGSATLGNLLKLYHDGTMGVFEAKGGINLSENTIVEGNLTVSGNITSANAFIPQYLFSHTNKNISVAAVDVWTNVTFDEEDSDIKMGIAHTFNDDTNYTFTIMESGVYDISYDYDVEDTSVSASDIDVAGRMAYLNGTEIKGSVFETDIVKQGAEVELTHEFLIDCVANDVLMFQFIASDPDVRISTHGAYGDHPESASIVIKKIAN